METGAALQVEGPAMGWNRDHQVRIEKEIALASRIQSHFKPPNTGLGHDSRIWGYSCPAKDVGGDIYDWVPLEDGSWLLYVADVADKGVPAALFMSALWFRIRSEVQCTTDIAEIMARLNAGFFPVMAPEGFFATIILGRYRPASGRLSLVNAGHLTGLLLAGDDGLFQAVPRTRSIALGLRRRSVYIADEYHLAPGDSLLLFTDGVTEAMNQSRNLFGTRGIRQDYPDKHGPPWGRGLVAAVKAWCFPARPQDDLTLVELWRESD